MSEIDAVPAGSAVEPAVAARPKRSRARSAPAARVPAPTLPDLAFTPEVEAATEPLYARLAQTIPRRDWAFHAPYIKAINDLKVIRKAVILAHRFMTPEICHGVADVVGDSLQLARAASVTDADVIVQAGLGAMAETSKLLAPDKTVLIPDPAAIDPLASLITADDIRLLRERFPGLPVVVHAATSLEVKAEADICCTAANAVAVVESLGVTRVIFVPDLHLARHVALRTSVKIIAWNGVSALHARFSVADVAGLRADYPGILVLADPRCAPEVNAAADMTAAPDAMIDHVRSMSGGRVVLLTEASLADALAGEAPQVEIIRTGVFSPPMKRITLETILRSLVGMTGEVTLPADLALRARPALERMIRVGD